MMASKPIWRVLILLAALTWWAAPAAADKKHYHPAPAVAQPQHAEVPQAGAPANI